MKNILVALDGSPGAESILPYVEGLARRLKARLVLLTCAPAEFRSGVPERGYLDRIAAPLRKGSLEVSTHVSPKAPGPGIVDASSEYDADIIAMTAHAKPGGATDILGSTAHEVLRSRVEPVLILREEDGRRAALGWKDPPAVVVGLDGSALALTALQHAERLATSLGAEVVLVRAVLGADLLSGAARYYGAVEDFAERYIAGIAESMRQRGFKVSTRTGHRSADQELIAAADSHPGSIIVVSTRGLTGRATLVLGSVTERVVRSQTHPVLAIPAARRG